MKRLPSSKQMYNLGNALCAFTVHLLDALQDLSRSQVTPELSMSMRIRPICVHIHTYIVPRIVIRFAPGKFYEQIQHWSAAISGAHAGNLYSYDL
jgi:hypothetical protein